MPEPKPVNAGEMFFKVEQNSKTNQVRIVVEGFIFDVPEGKEIASALCHAYRDLTMQVLKEANPDMTCLKHDDPNQSLEDLLRENGCATPTKKHYIN